MATYDATVASMWRYPVKSMLGETVDAVVIGERGLAGDRAYALVDEETGFVVSAKNPRRWGRLFACRSEYLEPPAIGADPPPVRITLPDGTVLRSDDRDANATLTRVLGRAVRLEMHAPDTPIIEDQAPDTDDIPEDVRGQVSNGQIALLAPPGTFFDCAAVHVMTTSSLAAASAAYPGGRFDPMRFRPNVLVDSGADGGFVENGWVGGPLRVGAEAELNMVMSTPRCVMTTLAQGDGDLPADRGILATIVRENRFEIPGLGPNACLGVYGMVTTGGAVAVGDPVRVGAA